MFYSVALLLIRALLPLTPALSLSKTPTVVPQAIQADETSQSVVSNTE
jgi:hypothetical protein